jgi:hypothetical protein
MAQPQNVIFWGAGATAVLGLRTTDKQTQFIKRITGADAPDKPLEKRIAEALDQSDIEPWRTALLDLITILGDGDDAYDSIQFTDDKQLDAMRRNWRESACDDELRRRILGLRLIYDWPALKSVVRICPGSSTDKFRLNDLFNILDMHIPAGFGVRAPARQGLSGGEKQYEGQFFDARRLIGAKNALLMILIALFYIDYQVCIYSKRDLLGIYRDFAEVLGSRMQSQGVDLSAKHRLDQPAFYQGDVGFVSLNYDPIALWVQFVANRELNKSADVPHIGSPAVPLHLFHDFGHLIPARRIGRGEANWPWYPLNEAATQRLNEQAGGDSRVRLTKFLFPHGCLCWRECPNCGKLSAYHGDQWDLHAHSLFPPPPLRAFDTEVCPGWVTGVERDQREKGLIDVRACLHCGTLTYAHHTQAVMQSSFKSRPPSFVEEIQRDLRATTMQAKHIILMGYSLPQDDVTYRAFFSASCQRHKGPTDQQVHCTVVGKESDHPGWYGPAELKTRNFPKDHAVNAAVDIFGDGNVRFYGDGVPDVFLDSGGRVTETTLERLLTWSSTL